MKNHLFAFLFMSLSVLFDGHAQLSGFSFSLGKDYHAPYGDNGISSTNSMDLQGHKYLHRFWSSSLKYRLTYGELAMDSVYNFNNHQLGLTISYWYLSDLRLLGKMSRSSCKGKMVALSYKFKSYLNAGLFANRSNIENQYSFLSYSLGLGFNLWQWKIPTKTSFRRAIGSLIIPYVEAHYNSPFEKTNLNNGVLYPNSSYNIQFGLKVALP